MQIRIISLFFFFCLYFHQYCFSSLLGKHCLFFFTEKYNFLGISIVGQSNERGDGGIYIGSIMKGGAVAADGRIEPGDMLLQVCVCMCVKVRCTQRKEKCVFVHTWDLDQESVCVFGFSASTCSEVEVVGNVKPVTGF